MWSRLLPQRAEILDALQAKPSCEVLVVGGGIHGAVMAHLAMLNGLDTVLLEREDYAFATSSRSSKMAHGGIRYLEQFDLSQVFEGLRARERLFKTAPHIVKPQPFLIPFFEGQKLNKSKFKLGLMLYDLLQRNSKLRHSWLPANKELEILFNSEQRKLLGCFKYFDGVMNDSRVVVENILAARQEGALCINHCALEHVGQVESGRVKVFWQDKLGASKGEIEAGIVVNCAGPWVPYLGKYRSSNLSDLVCYSQGVHLIFNKEWREEAILFPLGERGRYYFVWPHFAGTLVGTTERAITELEDDPKPVKEEIDEVLARLTRDLPNSGLDRSSLHYAFAGVRTIALRGKTAVDKPSKLSRKAIWNYQKGVLSLIGGKFTIAHSTAEDGLRQIFRLAGLSRPIIQVCDRKLPGAEALETEVQAFHDSAKSRHVPINLIERAVSRLGARVKDLGPENVDLPQALERIGEVLLRGEVEMALLVEQAETLEDLMRRRLELEYLPDHGFSVLPQILKLLKEHRPGIDIAAEEQRYRERIASILEGLAPNAT